MFLRLLRQGTPRNFWSWKFLSKYGSQTETQVKEI